VQSRIKHIWLGFRRNLFWREQNLHGHAVLVLPACLYTNCSEISGVDFTHASDTRSRGDWFVRFSRNFIGYVWKCHAQGYGHVTGVLLLII